MEPQDVAAELAAAEDARRAAVAASVRPWWVDAVGCLLVGVGVGLAATWEPWGLALGVVVVGFGLVLAAGATRRRGRVTDERAVGSSMARYFMVFIPLQFLSMFLGTAVGQPARSLLLGALWAVLGFVFLRLDERYQARRAAAGDYGPGGLT